MSSIDTSSLQPTGSTERKRWETPVVIVASAERQTLSNQNSGGVDVVYTSTSIGS
jgi:hypothetical protein